MEVMAPSSLSSASARGAQSLNWTWSREEAIALGVPRLSATFNQLLGTDTFVRDTKGGQFSNVSTVANRQNIVDAAMTVAPEWALRAGAEVFSATPAAAARGDVKAEGRIGRVVLMGDLSTLNVDAATDPIASLQPMTELPAGSALAFVIEYCGAPGSMKLEAKINNMAAASELEPLPMKAVAGCGVMPGMLSLASLASGSYELEITIIEPNGSRLMTKQRFALK
jgi:hypothetical protein